MSNKEHCWIQTYTGRKFHYYDPHPDQLHIDDIAHALSNNCRFNGHTREFYSVAQHSVIVAELVELIDPEHAACGLMHDAPEAVVSDVPKPFKESISHAFGPVEDAVWKTVAEKYGLPPEMPKAVKTADFQALLLEKSQLLPVHVEWPGVTEEMYLSLPKYVIEPVGPDESKAMFMDKFNELIE